VRLSEVHACDHAADGAPLATKVLRFVSAADRLRPRHLERPNGEDWRSLQVRWPARCR
jgi:hypothetical protein